MRTNLPSGTVYRHVFGVVSVLIANFLLLPFLITGSLHARQQPGILVAIIVIAGLLWLTWAVGWRSKVTIGPAGIVIDNAFVRRFVPWPLFADVKVGRGIEFELRDGTRYGSVSYSGALPGPLTGYRGMVKIRRQILASCGQYGYWQYANQEFQQVAPARQVKIIWWPLLVYIVPFEVLAIASLIAGH